MSVVLIKRIYEEASAQDGYRVLVDRLWPRGMSHERAHLDVWLKEVAPSTDLRTDWHHDPAHWPEFEKAYREELRTRPETVQALTTLKQALADHPTVTLLYAAHGTEQNNAVVLQDYLVDTVDGVTTTL